MSRLRSLRRDDRGFTLIELSTTMALLGIFFAAAALVLSGALRSSSAVEDQAAVQSNARAVLDSMAGEIRQGYFDSTWPSGSTTWIKSGMTSTSFTIFTPDRVTPFHVRAVSYRLTGGQLQRGLVTSTTSAAGPWMVGGTALQSATPSAYQPVVESVVTTGGSPSQFTYYDSSDNPTTTPANITYVQIKLVVSPRGSQGRTSTYTVKAGPRDLT